MEISWADILGSVPIAVAILIAWLYMDRNRTALEREREKNRSDDDKATNDRLKELIALQNQAVVLQQTSNDRMAEWTAAQRATAASVKDMDEALAAHNAEMLDVLKPIGEDAAQARASSGAAADAIGQLQAGQRNLEAGLERLLGLIEARGQTDTRILDQVEALAGRIVALNEAITALRGELTTAINGPA